MYYVLNSIFRGNIGLESIQLIELFMLKVIGEGLFGSISQFNPFKCTVYSLQVDFMFHLVKTYPLPQQVRQV